AFPNCNLYPWPPRRYVHVPRSFRGIAGGATASCADESPSARSPEGDSVSIGGAAAFTKGATLKHTGWRNGTHPAHCGCNGRQPARISNCATAIAAQPRTLLLPVQKCVISVVVHDPGTLQMIGKVLLASMEDDDIEAYLSRTKLTPLQRTTIPDKSVL